MSTTTNLISFFEQINTAFRTAPRDTNAQTESLVQALPVVERIVQRADDSLQMAGVPPSPGVTTLFNTGEEAVEGRLTFDHGRIRIAVAQTLNEDLVDKAIERLRQLVQETQNIVPGLNVGITGGPVLDYDQMAQSKKDTTLASIVSLILCAIIFIYGYNETGPPGEGDDLPGRRAGLHARVRDVDRRTPEHFDGYVCAHADWAGD